MLFLILGTMYIMLLLLLLLENKKQFQYVVAVIIVGIPVVVSVVVGVVVAVVVVVASGVVAIASIDSREVAGGCIVIESAEVVSVTAEQPQDNQHSSVADVG